MAYEDLSLDDKRELESLRKLLYRAIVELGYVQEMEDHSMCASAEGQAVVEDGMKLLGVADLSEEELPFRLVRA
jgi:hypothetical protein